MLRRTFITLAASAAALGLASGGAFAQVKHRTRTGQLHDGSAAGKSATVLACAASCKHGQDENRRLSGRLLRY